MRRMTGWLVLAMAVTFTATGCLGRAIKEGVGVARGAKGIYAPIRAVAPDKESRPLGEYTRFELGEFTDDFGGKTPGELLALLPAAFEEQLAAKNLLGLSGGKTLLVRGKILHYEDATMIGFALGPLEETIARVELVDKATGNVLGVANCVGRTDESVNAGVPKKAEGLAKAIVSWIASRYPKKQE